MPTSETIAELAKAAYSAGDFRRAADLFAQAVATSRDSGEGTQWAELANNQSVALLQANDAQSALDVLEGTVEAFEAAGEALNQAMAIGNRAAALDSLGRVGEAEAEYIRCADMLKALDEKDLHADVLKAVSALQLRAGRQMEALGTMKRGIDGKEAPGVKGRLLSRLIDIVFSWFR